MTDRQADPRKGERRSEPRIAVIGTGFGGLGAAIELKRAGFDDLVIFERADDVGGVWRENTYPGAACDIPSPVLLVLLRTEPAVAAALLAAAGHPRLPAPGCRQVRPASAYPVRHRGHRRRLRRARTGTWTVHTSSGEVVEIDVLISAVGQLSRPVLAGRSRDARTSPARRSTRRSGITRCTWRASASR